MFTIHEHLAGYDPPPRRRHQSDIANTLADLEDWYRANCDGDWEHDWRVRISTLDNPGWSIAVNLDDTQAPLLLNRVDVERTPDDWYACWLDGRVFNGAGGPGNLADLLGFFLAWVNGRAESAG